MKKRFLYALSLVFLLALFGCSSETQTSADDVLKEIAAKEKDWLLQLQPISEQIKSDIEKWEKGEITRDQLIEKLSAHKQKVKELRDESDQYYLSLKLPEEIKKSPDYSKGLYYGQSIRLNVYSFLFEATNSAKQITDEELKDIYQNEMVDSYNRKIGLLQTALNKLAE